MIEVDVVAVQFLNIIKGDAFMFPFFSKQEPQKKERYVFPTAPCYAVVVNKHSRIDIQKFFSGEMDDKLFLIELFSDIKDAINHLKKTPSGHASYVLCMDLSLNEVKALKAQRKGFGEHIKTAVNFHDYAMTTWEANRLPPDKVEILLNSNKRDGISLTM